MSQEPKMCPFRWSSKETEYMELTPLGVDPPRMTPVPFGPCLQEKCAMWRVINKERTTIVEYPDGATKRVDTELAEVGYCGLAGKP